MSLITITIRDDGENWHKGIRIFGLLIYSRHDFTKDIEKRQIGFTAYPDCPMEIDDGDDYPEEHISK